MTFEALKAEILARIRQFEICDGYQQVLLANDKAALITAVVDMKLIEYAYQAGIVDDTLLAEFTDAELNAAKIYKSSVTLSNPTADLYFIKSGNVVINADDNVKVKARILGAVNITVNLSGTAFAVLRTTDTSILTVNLSGSAGACIEALQHSQITIVQDDDTVLQVLLNDSSTLNLTANDTSRVIVKANQQATVGYAVNPPATADIKTFGNATSFNNSIA